MCATFDRTITPLFHFKFQWTESGGGARGFFYCRGTFDGKVLDLGKPHGYFSKPVRLPMDCLSRLEIHEQQDYFLTTENAGGKSPIHIQIRTATVARQLKAAVDQALSASEVEVCTERLQASEFRMASCPRCHATLNLSGLPVTPHVYCRYCHCISAAGDPPPPATDPFSLCQNCEMYAPLRKTSIFYLFPFLIVWFSWQSKFCCSTCWRRLAWKMLAINLLLAILPIGAAVTLFPDSSWMIVPVCLMGVGYALFQMGRCYLSGLSPRAGELEKLQRSLLACDVEQTLGVAHSIAAPQPCDVGLYYSLGVAAAKKSDSQAAVEHVEKSLDLCANFAPAYPLLTILYRETGDAMKSHALKKQWKTVSGGST